MTQRQQNAPFVTFSRAEVTFANERKSFYRERSYQESLIPAATVYQIGATAIGALTDRI